MLRTLWGFPPHTAVLVLSGWLVKGLQLALECRGVSVVCGVRARGGRESREEQEIKSRRGGDTIVYLPGQKSAIWLDM